MDTWPGWKATIDAASSLEVSRACEGAAGMEGAICRVAAWHAVRTCYLGDESMTHDTARSIVEMYIRPSGSHQPGFAPRYLCIHVGWNPASSSEEGGML